MFTPSSRPQLLLLGGAACVLRGRLSLGALTAFFANADSFARGCAAAHELLHEAFALRPLCARHFALLDRAPRLAWDAPGGKRPSFPAREGRGAPSPLLSLRGVSFGFPGRQGRAALRNVTLEVPAGAMPPPHSGSPLFMVVHPLSTAAGAGGRDAPPS